MYKKIKDEIIEKYPLISKADCSFDCYLVEKSNYVIFWDEVITKRNKLKVLNTIYDELRTSHFPKMKFFVIVAPTEDEFKKENLIYTNAETFNRIRESGASAAFYLIDCLKKNIYMSDDADKLVGNYIKNIVRRINYIVRGIIKQTEGENEYE